MSATLLQRVSSHIITDGGLLSTYSLRYYQWLDDDLNGAGKVAMFRGTGIGGEINRHVQHLDVHLFLLANRDDAKNTDDDMLGVVQYLRDNPSTTGAFNLFPFTGYTGPTFLQNGRALFELPIRVGVTDH